MKKYSSRAHFEALHPRTHGRPATPATPTIESKARGERRRKIEELAEEAARKAAIDHFDDDVAKESP